MRLLVQSASYLAPLKAFDTNNFSPFQRGMTQQDLLGIGYEILHPQTRWRRGRNHLAEL